MGTVDFMGQVSLFLGTEFSWVHHDDGNISVSLTQQSSTERDALRLKYQSLIGSLNWLAHTTRPDLSTAVSLLTQHQSSPSP